MKRGETPVSGHTKKRPGQPETARSSPWDWK